MSQSRKYPQLDLKILYARSAGRCAFSNCRKLLILEATHSSKAQQIAEIAHIVAHSSDGPRGDANFPPCRLDTYANWILLCPTCHAIVDSQPESYPINALLTIKQEHEQWVEEQLDEGMSKVSFVELEVAAKALVAGKFSEQTDFQIIPPELKITKNKLTQISRTYITMGLIRSFEVERFLASMAQVVDADFPERLKNGFKQRYVELSKNSSGDELFMGMLDFTNLGSADFKQQAAGLAILAHLFYICEIFEK